MCGKRTLMIGVFVFLWASGVVAQTDVREGLIAYYKLDEEAGAVAGDSSGNRFDGTLEGEALEWVPGRFAGALSYVAEEDDAHVQIPTTGMSISAGTVSMWGYLREPQASRTRYFFGHTTQPAYNNRIQIYMDGGTSMLDIGLGDLHARNTDILALPTTTWVHVVLTWNDGAYVVYVDGAKVADGTYTGLASLHEFADIGDEGNPDENESFDGFLDEVRVYSRAISAAEVKELFEAPASPRIRAWGPSPADGALDVVAPLFTWKSVDTVRLHDVYLGTEPNLTEANRVAFRYGMSLYYHSPGLEPGVAYYWRVDEIGPDMVTVYPGTVWSFLSRPFTAYYPQPADGSNEAPADPDLTWQAGIAALKHQVYFSDRFNDVNERAADADRGVLEDPNFAPGQLDELATYYWRVDELGAGDSVVTGEVWSFATYALVDDFESYTDDVEAGTTIFDTWLDGLINGTGSTIGYWNAPFCEQTIMHGGLQSMPFDYNNVVAPYYSEGERDFGSSQDWTANGADMLTIHLRGRATNGNAPAYVGLQDAQNRSAFVTHPDPNVATTTKWGAWKVPLSDFADAGVSVDRVRKLLLGVGDRDNPTQDGFGLLYIDDIYLTKPALVAEE